jgi:hypothetical protein
MNELFVMAPNGQPVGPYTVESLARAVADGVIPREAFAAPAGGSWQAIAQLPEVLAQVDALVRSRTASPAAPQGGAQVGPPATTGAQGPVSVRPPPPLPVRGASKPPPGPTPQPPLVARASSAPPPLPVSSVRPSATPPPVVVSPTASLPTAETVLAPPTGPAFAPVAVVAQVPAAAPVSAPAPAPASASVARPAADTSKPPPWPQWLALAIFGGFFGVSLLVLLVGLIVGGGDDLATSVKGASSGAPSAAPSASAK